MSGAIVPAPGASRVRVVRVEVRGDVFKNPIRRYPWCLPVAWILEDGREVKHTDSFERKRDALARADKLPANDTGLGPTYVTFDEAGEVDGYTSYPFGEF